MTPDECFDDANQRIMQRQAENADLRKRVEELEADRKALMAAVRHAVDYDPGLRAYTPFMAALPTHLKEEASK